MIISPLHLYEPDGITPINFSGSSSVIGKANNRPNVVLKYPLEPWWDSGVQIPPTRRHIAKSHFEAEKAILEHLGIHPRIIK
jgi:hypothetical protein